MAKFDTLVTDHLVHELLQPDRLRAQLASLSSLRAEKAAQVDGRVAVLRTEVTSAEDKLKRLYRMVEEGVTDLDDVLKERLAALKTERDRARTALERMLIVARPAAEIEPGLVEQFG